MRCVQSPPRLEGKQCQINSGCSLAAAVFGIFFLNGRAAATLAAALLAVWGRDLLRVEDPASLDGTSDTWTWYPGFFAGMERWVGLGWASPPLPHGTPRCSQLSCHHAAAVVGAHSPPPRCRLCWHQGGDRGHPPPLSSHATTALRRCR